MRRGGRGQMRGEEVMWKGEERRERADEGRGGNVEG